jgi:energy-coupling factor transporter ATP-binding protein EcfA2
MQRVVVVGPPGSGKTTVARTISRRLGLPHTELDSLWWDPNWTEAGARLFSDRAQVVVENESWVVDGNYYSTGARDTIWSRADTLVWLDLARWVTVPRVVRRTLVRGVRHTELWSGNRESVRLAFRPDSIIVYAMRAHPKYNQRYEGLDADPSLRHLTWIRLTSPGAVRRWVRTLAVESTR